MIARLEHWLRRLRNRISRSSWFVRHFGLTSEVTSGHEPGLVLIQIDGLAEHELRRALENGKMPFLQGLRKRQDYVLHGMYSGLPSSTPAVQAEFFYGVQQAVPAFCYYDRKSERIFSMFEGADARELQARLEEKSAGLLKGGSAYGNIYTGGATEAHFCMSKLGWPAILSKASPPIALLLVLLHVASLLRVMGLLVVELGLALVDSVRGIIAKKDVWQEIKFITSRVSVCIVLRELVVIRSAVDLLRGLPIVHMNFLGYDEQAHRRGPDSAFAHWSLKGIDKAIHRVYRAGQRSMRRDYDVWIYSDHGQDKVVPYAQIAGKSVQRKIADIFNEVIPVPKGSERGIQFERAKMLRVKRHRPETQPPERPPVVTSLGPWGAIYLGFPVEDEKREELAKRLVGEAKIPMIIAAFGENTARVWTKSGAFVLPEDAEKVLGRDHPYLWAVTSDLVSISRHDDAGDFFISGFSLGEPPVSFPQENGSHGGVSPQETSAFLLLPDDIPLARAPDEPLRLIHLRQAAQQFLRGRVEEPTYELSVPEQVPETIRLMTYNVHNCCGMDGYVSPHRIARVIERERPDIIALQEVDVLRYRSGYQDQAALLARYLRMNHVFHPAMQYEEEEYGDAILSRFPMELIRAAALPYMRGRLIDEVRGALWVKVILGGGAFIHVLNTHFGLGRLERMKQAEAILGGEWLSDRRCEGPIILCGDFNSGARSPVYRKLTERLADVQDGLAGHKPVHTFSGRHPLHRIDHIFVSEHFQVKEIHVPQTHRTVMASDHLPLTVSVSCDAADFRGALDFLPDRMDDSATMNKDLFRQKQGYLRCGRSHRDEQS
jgi:endonuclease/exonuclease/phosphatase family metal-dependent hydrolase